MKIVDAENRTIGRVATEVARALMGKDKASYKPNVLSEEKVKITNASKAKIDQKKLREKIYQRYTGHPSGRKTMTLEELITKKGYAEVFRKAVYGMLPSNRMRKLRMKNLEIID